MIAWKKLVDALDAALRKAQQGASEVGSTEYGVLRQQVRAAPASIPLKEARRALLLLRNRRQHEKVIELSRALLDGGQEHPGLRRLLGQGLIETGQLNQAIEVLDAGLLDVGRRLARVAGPSAPAEALFLRREQAELQGVLGRAYKQRYVDNDREAPGSHAEDAERALEYYGEAYRAAPIENLWHAINCVAIRSHQHRRRAGALERDAESDRLAREVLETIEALEAGEMLEYWDFATRAEALLALGRFDEMDDAVEEYLARPDLTAFAVGGFIRQLEQLWELDAGSGRGHDLLPRLAAHQRALEGRRGSGGDTSAPRAPDKAEFQPTHPDNRAARRARGVARIGTSFTGGGGSGFLIDPTLIWPGYRGLENIFLLTCAHVCSDHVPAKPSEAGPIEPRTAKFAFLGPQGKVDRGVLVNYGELLWSSSELDAALLMLDAGPRAEPYPLGAPGTCTNGPAHLIGHPLGAGLWYSSRENAIQDLDVDRLRYTTPTEPGCSGCPVFDGDWKLIGLHRGYERDVSLNYGVRIDRILDALRQELRKFGGRGPSPYEDELRV